MQKKTIIFQLGNNDAMSAGDLQEVNANEHPYAPQLSFYVAQNNSDAIVGSVQINPNDAVVQALTVAGWIKSGFNVNQMSYKELNKILSAAQKALKAEELATKTIEHASAPAAPGSESKSTEPVQT